MNRLVLIIVLLGISVTFSGCLLELMELEGAEMGAAGGGEGMMLAEDEALGMRYGTELQSGRFAITNENAAYSLYEDVTIKRAAGENPKLYVEGKSNPIGEVLTNDRKIKLVDGSVYKVGGNVFSVVGDEVNMRASPSPAANIVARVRQGHMVVNLGEVNDGWYKVEIMQNKVQQMGYIKGSLLTPVILADSNATTGYSYWDLQAGAIPLPDEARVKEDLLKFGIPGIIRLDRTQRLGWNFESLSEIKSYKPWGANFLNGDCSYYVSADLELENERTGRQCRCRVTMRYNVSRNAWKCMHIADEYFEEIGKPQQSPSNANQRYPEYRPPVDNGYARPYSYGHPPSAPNQNNTDVGITANTGSLKVELSDRNPITIAIDRRQYRVHGASVTVNQLPYGLHTLKIFSYGSDRYGRVHTGIIFEGKVQTGMLTSVVYDFRTHNINIQQLH